jgi:HK97 family phage prohead protease
MQYQSCAVELRRGVFSSSLLAVPWRHELLWRHNRHLVVAGWQNVQLWERPEGLRLRAWPDDSTTGNTVTQLLASGRKLALSISWRPTKTRRLPGGVVEVVEGELEEVSLTDRPAAVGTGVDIASPEEIVAERRAKLARR